MVFRVASGGGSSGLVIGAGATPITGGTASRVLFEGATNVLSESADLTFAATTGVLTIGGTTSGAGIVVTGGTITASSPLFGGTQTWNNAAVTFNGQLFTLTDTASASGSTFFKYMKGGAVTLGLSVISGQNYGVLYADTLLLGNSPTAYAMNVASGNVSFYNSAQNAINANYLTDGATGSDFRQNSTGIFSWSSNSSASTAADTGISRSAAGVLAVGTGAQGSNAGTIDATLYKAAGTSGVANFGPAAVTSITVKGGIITAIA